MRSSLAKSPVAPVAPAAGYGDLAAPSNEEPGRADVNPLPAPRTSITSTPPVTTSLPINTSPYDGFVFASNPNGGAAQRYRKMCAEIVSVAWPRKLMLVTSPSAGDGKTVTAVNLAFALAERQKSVLLLELSLERPRFRYVFGEPPAGKGVEALLRGEAYPSEVIGELGDSGIAVAGVNAASERNSLLNDNPRLDRFLESSEKRYDWTIIDAPDVASCTAVPSMARVIQPVIMVVRSGQTAVDSLRSAVAALGNRINFVIMNDTQR